MKNKLGLLTALLLTAVAFSAAASERAREEAVTVRATLELKDGSRLVGTPLEKTLPVTLDFMKAAIPLEKIRTCEIRHKDERVVLGLANGDRLTGTLELAQFQLDTAMGRLAPDLAQIDRMTFTASHGGSLPAGEGSLSFGGVNWLPWRTPFEVQGDKLASLPRARAGFNYGHSGAGRGAALMSNIGNADWRDYRVEFDFCMVGTDPSFNPHGMGLDWRGGSFAFHVTDAKENWNERGGSCYNFSVEGNGAWRLYAVYNAYCDVPMGYGNPRKDAERVLASGSSLHPDWDRGNHYRLEVRGPHIQIWMDDQTVVDVTDDKMGETIGGQTLDHGGVGFSGGFDTMFWIKNFSATAL